MSAEKTGSLSWYRVAQLRPRLRSHARIQRHLYRGEVWYVLQDQASGRFHRFTPTANLIISLMDGERSLQEIWDLARSRLGEEAPGQDELIQLLASLHRADVLLGDVTPDLTETQVRRARSLRLKLKQYFANPLALKFPLVDPDCFVERLLPRLRLLLGWPGALLWLATVSTALVLAAMHWPALTRDVADRIFATENLLLIWLLFPFLKGLHELGHAVAVKAGGGQVREMGLMLLVMVPVPYVDASAASGFRSRRGRMLVGAAGVIIETFCAAVAMILWAYVEPGLTRAILFNIILIGGLSTLVFNLNPLLRFDAYYILADYLEMPNLGQRAGAYLGYLVNRHLFRVQQAQSPARTGTEAAWLATYAMASFLYRVLVTVGIVLLVASKYFFVGVLLALWAVANMIVVPVMRRIAFLFGPRLGVHRGRALAVTGVMLATALIVIVFLPAPSWTRAEGVVWAPEQSRVRSGNACFIRRVMTEAEQLVRRGDPLIECEDPELVAQVQVLEARLLELEASSRAYFSTNRLHADIVSEEIGHIEERLAESRRRVGELLMRSPGDGRFIMQDISGAPGRYIQRGETVAYVLAGMPTTVRVVVKQDDVDLVRVATKSVAVRIADRIGDLVPASIQREVPAATDQLPSIALSVEGGGKLGLNPRSRTQAGEAVEGEARSLAQVFLFDLDLPAGTPVSGIGQRVFVRFDHRPEPLALQWYRGVRRILLSRFNV